MWWEIFDASYFNDKDMGLYTLRRCNITHVTADTIDQKGDWKPGKALTLLSCGQLNR